MNENIGKLLQFEHNLKQCESIHELRITIVNELRTIIPYEQAILLGRDLNGKPKVESISDIASIEKTSPFVQYMEALSGHLEGAFSQDEITPLRATDLPTHLAQELLEYAPSSILWIPLKSIKNNIEIDYSLLLLRDQVFEEKEVEVLHFLRTSLNYGLFAMRKCAWRYWIDQKYLQSQYIKRIAIGIGLLLILPVRMSVLAPCEIVPKDPLVVTSPIEGVVDHIAVEPNEKVKVGELLVALEKIDLQNNYLISQKKLNTAQAELFTAKQAGFYDPEKRSQIAQLSTQVALSQAEMDYAKSLLAKTDIYSDVEGVAIIDSPNEWQGRPVVTGEKLLLVANPQSVEIKIMLPVDDALFLENGGDVNLFLDNELFGSWDASISHIAYKPELTPENILSYKVIAHFTDIDQDESLPRIGLRGTAKLYSDYVPLFYYLFHKPLTGLRQMIGW